MLDITLLGPTEVRDEAGHDLTPAGQRERAAVALLALAAPTTVSTERLATELYGDEGRSDPRNAVQAVISRLRKALGRSAGSLETRGGGYRLVDVRLDIDEAESRLAHTRTLAGQNQLDHLGNVLALWRGPSLADLAPSESLDAERFRVDELKASAEEMCLDLRIQLGEDDTTLIADLEAATRNEPMRERRWALLMHALYNAGRQADALRAYQRARQLLGQHLGLEPGPALVALERRILDHDPALATPAEATAQVQSAALPSNALPSGTVSVLLCDVEGSVRQWEASPRTTADNIADLHDIWTAAVAAHNGHLVKSTGDGVLAVFTTADDAIAAAVAGQRVHHRAPTLKVRVAVNTGPITPVDGDYRGPLVNRCARLLELTAGGQILVTGTAAALARGALDTTISLRSLGSHWLRDVPEPVDIHQVNSTGIAAEFPDVHTLGPTNLPRIRNEVLGRDDLRATVVGLAGERPLVTLLGPGGIGKTTLSLAAAWEVASTRNVVFVDLAATSDPATVARRVADSVNQSDDDRPPTERLIDRLRTKTDLIVLDNAEHLLDAVAELLDEVLRHELKGSFVVTSRQPLAVAGEYIVSVPPLTLPANDADLIDTAATPAVALFLDRLRLARPDLAVPNGLLPVVAHICRRLDGIPLAIELAASRASVLAIEDIAARLDDQLRLLRQVPAHRERRHRSLEAVVTWSLDQLAPDIRALFRMLSVFAGDFDLSGVESVMAAFGLDERNGLDQLSELSSASLLSTRGKNRFRVLEPIRQVAATELETCGRTVAAQRAHAEWITDLLSSGYERTPSEAGSTSRLHTADQEADEVRVALARIADGRFIDLVPRLAVPAGYWFLSRDPVRGVELWEQIITCCDPGTDPDRDDLTYALAVMGLCTVSASHPGNAQPAVVTEALRILDIHDHRDRGLFRVVASYSFVHAADFDTATRLLAEADLIVSSDDPWEMAILDMAVATVTSLALMMNMANPYEVDDAERRGERAAETLRRINDNWALGVTLGELGRLKQHKGDLEGAEKCLLESVELFGDTEFHGLHYLMSELGRLASNRDDHDAAADYHRQALEIARSDGGSLCLAVTFGAIANSAELRGDISTAIENYERALALDAAQLTAGIPSTWAKELDRLRASQPG